MPYNIPNETKEQVRWMESCVSSVMKSNSKLTQDSAIAICKAQLKKNGWKVPKDSESLVKPKYRRVTYGNATI